MRVFALFSEFACAISCKVLTGATPCQHFARNGTCKFGEKCKYSHDPLVLQQCKPVTSPYAKRQRHNQQGGYSGNQPKKVCRNFQQSGHCKYGQRCRFSHVRGGGYGQPKPVNFTNRNTFNNQRKKKVSLDELESCKICMEPYDINKPDRIPRTLACSHVLCTGCIKKYVKDHSTSYSKSFKCPFKCPELTSCKKGLPKQSFILNDVIMKQAYRIKLNDYYIQQNGGSTIGL